MRLKETQRIFAEALLDPPANVKSPALRPPGRVPAVRAATALVRPGASLRAAERIEIYRRSYWCRLLDSLAEDFPGLAAVVGQQGFLKLARAYLWECPSRSWTLRDLGSRLEAWLARHREFAGARPDLAIEMARLEWAHIHAFDGPEAPPLEPEQLGRATADLRLRLQPYVSLLALRYPVDEIRVQAVEACAGDGAAGAGRRLRGRIRMLRPAAEPIYLAVHRFELDVYYRRLDQAAYLLLTALRRGHTLGSALDMILENRSWRGADAAKTLQSWFAAWSRLGWLLARQPAVEGTERETE